MHNIICRETSIYLLQIRSAPNAATPCSGRPGQASQTNLAEDAENLIHPRR